VRDVVDAVAARGPALGPDVTVADARAAAVLVALFASDDGSDGARVVLTRRSSTLRNHRGEIAFPGGRQDPGEALHHAALRETNEEIGIEPAAVEIVGELDQLTTVASRFLVAPFVGVLAEPPEYRPNPAEIDRAFDVALAELLDPDAYREEVWDFPWGERHVSFFLLDGETVWGATARILRQLLVLVTGTADPYADCHAHPQL
jgi:8-oxo-dGTP pyrophosphatase MutT (NUDIX family)